MTHVKNVETLDKIMRICTGYGASYNPVRPKLQLITLNALLAQAHEAMRGEKLARTFYEDVTNTREVAFKELPKLAARIVALLSSSGASAQTMDDARMFFHKLYGYIAKDSDPIASGEAVNTSPKVKRTKGQHSYASIADNFEKLVSKASAAPCYDANEDVLKVDALESKVAELKKLNTDAIDARVKWSTGLTARDKVLYTTDAAICTTGSEVKDYVKAAFGPDSKEYGNVKNLNFVNYKS